MLRDDEEGAVHGKEPSDAAIAMTKVKNVL